MIPIRDNQPTSSFPVATYALMGTNLVVFLFQLQWGLDNEAVFYLYGLVPGKYTVWDLSRHFSLLNQIFSLFTYMFFHGGVWHFLGNMWFLYIFGDNIEAHFGSVRFIGFYILCGLISGGFHFLLNPVSLVPTIGASGAIAGVMGAYFLLYPGAKILTLIPIIIIPWLIEIPAFIFLGFWFLMQFLNATGSGSGSGIAWWAHIGGFVAGVVLVKLNNRLPETGVRERLNRLTQKKHTPRLQVIMTQSQDHGPDLYGQMEVSSLEALTGTKKLVSIPWGFYKPLYRVNVPPGVKKGTRLRLAGMGKTIPNHEKGDLFLTIQIKNAI
ncbi:MAG: rhomboid family intramembrane serine protease [Proteobacteria bacterium]|nr:rhomboid family intramembrane serine protease [Desulfobacula sp.]MBU3951188.1 rhomboid family intramembrane serine protease [Pseudomonadota bacterium]MBU4133559.1 rhomboid family intramembrane serine protease [Pseudomonadota bacterium]